MCVSHLFNKKKVLFYFIYLFLNFYLKVSYHYFNKISPFEIKKFLSLCCILKTILNVITKTKLVVEAQYIRIIFRPDFTASNGAFGVIAM